MKSFKSHKTIILYLLLKVSLFTSSFAQIHPPNIPNMPTVMDFDKKRPTVVVLIHGVTGFPSTPRNPQVNNLAYARHDWGFDLIKGLFGTESDMPTTFADESPTGILTGSNWVTKLVSNSNPLHHFVTVYGKPKLDQNFYTPFSVMFTYRDGSVSLKNQVSAVAAQIVQNYNAVFGTWPADKKPQLILLCHSFGGIVARTICSNPSSIPSGTTNYLGTTSTIPASSFTATDQSNMNFIRNKTLYIVTLATPHEGSPVTLNSDIGSVLQYTPFIGQQIDNTDPDTYVIRQLTTQYVAGLNNSILAPQNCKRINGSLIPIHAIGGRVPAGPLYFSNPNQNDNDINTLDGGIPAINKDLVDNESNCPRLIYESYNLLRVDYAMHLFLGAEPWGTTPGDNTALDIIKTVDVNPITGCLKSMSYGLIEFGLKPRVYYLRNSWSNYKPCNFKFTAGTADVSDNEIDNDGFVPINSALGVKLGTSTKNYFDHATGGSWYRFYRSAGDYHNHGTIRLQADIGVWLRQNIIGYHPNNFLFNTGLGVSAAGPNITTSGTRSIW